MTHLVPFTPLMRRTVGFDRFNDLFESLLSQSEDSVESYPPYNIVKTGENDYLITLAVAGFAEKDLDITLKENTLSVSGKHSETTEQSDEKTFLHRGIASRAFTRNFRLADDIRVEDAQLKDGLLSISLVREVREEKKPRLIPINAKGAAKKN